MTSDATVGPRRARLRWIDAAIVAGVVLWLLVGLGRLGHAGVGVAAGVRAELRQANRSADVGAGGSFKLDDAYRRAVGTKGFLAWWGTRAAPVRSGGDALDVLARFRPGTTLGALLGAAIRDGQRHGTAFNRVIVPNDMAALFGREPATTKVAPDGSESVRPWTPIESHANAYTDVPLTREAYAPVLTVAQEQAIESSTRVKRKTKAFAMGEGVSGGSGVWVLHAVDTKPRRFLLLPLEVSPAQVAP